MNKFTVVKFTDQNIMQRGDSMKLNFEGFEMQKLIIATHRGRRIDYLRASMII